MTAIRLKPGDKNGPRLERRGTNWVVGGGFVDGTEWCRPASALEVSLFQALDEKRRQLKRIKEKKT